MKIITIAIEEEENEAGGHFHSNHNDVMNCSRVIFRVLKSGDVVVQKGRTTGGEMAKKVQEWMSQIPQP